MMVMQLLFLSSMMTAAAVSARQSGPVPISATAEMPTSFPQTNNNASNSSRNRSTNNNNGGSIRNTNRDKSSNTIKLDEKHYAETAPHPSSTSSAPSAATFEAATATCTVPITPETIATLQIEMPLSQSFLLSKYKPKQPSIDVSLPHAAVATHTGYIIFYKWIDEYPNRADTNVDLSEISRGYWMRNSVFYMAEEDDTDATVVISGNTAMVGMPDVHTRYGRYAGVVYLYEYNENDENSSDNNEQGGGGIWEAKGPLTPNYFPSQFDMHGEHTINDQTNHAFGASIHLQGDLLVVGAPGVENFAGAVYVFTRHDMMGGKAKHWVQKQQHVPPHLDETCPGAVFGGGIQLYNNFIAIGADCREWMFLYQYHMENNRLLLLHDEETFIRQNDDDLMAAVVVTEEYFIYSVYDNGVFIYEKRSEGGGAENYENVSGAPLYKMKQFIDCTPFEDVGFGSHMAMNEEKDLLIIFGNYRAFFFSINGSNKNSNNNNGYSNRNNNGGEEDQLWELVLTFEVPHIDRGISFSDGKLVLAGPKNVWSMNLKEELQSILPG